MWIVPKNICSSAQYGKEVKALSSSLHMNVVYRSLSRSSTYFERGVRSQKRHFYSKVVLSSKLPIKFRRCQLRIRKYPITSYRKFSLQDLQSWTLHVSKLKKQYKDRYRNNKSLYRTPSMCDIKHSTYKDISKLFKLIERGKQDSLVSQVHRQFVKRANEKINPRWVEQCMGLPIGWVLPTM
jgi:hypothetical protein